MTTVADLPSTVRYYPDSWAWSNDPPNREHFHTWSVPYEDFATFQQVVLFTVETITVVPDPPGPLVTIDRVNPLVCPTDPTLVALGIRPRREPQILGRGESHASGPWEETSVGSGIYRPRMANPPWKLIFPVVRFGTPAYPTSGEQAFLSVSENDSTERVTVPGNPYWLYDTDPMTPVERVAYDLGLSRGTSTFRITWHEIADLPAVQAVLHPLLDKVNNASVTIPFNGSVCPAGTLKSSTKSANTQVSYGNNVKSDLSMELKYIPGGWNRAVASVASHAGQLLRINSAAGPPFAATDFSVLFNPTV